jgi:hypothetical protein
VDLDLEFIILLPGGGVFRFSGPFPISEEQWEHIRRVMDAMAPGLVATANEDSNGCAPTVVVHTARPVNGQEDLGQVMPQHGVR